MKPFFPAIGICLCAALLLNSCKLDIPPVCDNPPKAALQLKATYKVTESLSLPLIWLCEQPHWDFGNGETSGGTWSYTYLRTGNYTISLVVTNDHGTDSAKAIVRIVPLTSYDYAKNWGRVQICGIDTIFDTTAITANGPDGITIHGFDHDSLANLNATIVQDSMIFAPQPLHLQTVSGKGTGAPLAGFAAISFFLTTGVDTCYITMVDPALLPFYRHRP